MRSFIHFYEFLLLATAYKDTLIHKNYNFLKSLSAMLRSDHTGEGFNLKNQIAVVRVRQVKQKTHKKEQIHPDPALKLPKADRAYATKDNLQRLSEIIREINERNGSHFDVDSSLKAILQLKDKLMNSDVLQRSAKTNGFEDFERYAVGQQLDDALIEVLEENYTFYRSLLSDPEHKKQIMRIFTPELFRQMQAEH